MDKVKQSLLEAMRQGADGNEQRLYRSGKLAGLFGGRSSLNAEIAAQATRDGLIELARTETRGKTVTEWVKVTAKGIEFLVQNESPLKALEELHALLKQSRDGLPAWFAELQGRLNEWNTRLLEEFQATTRKLDRLGQQVVEALQRAERMGPALPEGAAGTLPWSNEAVLYLGQRQQAGIGERCPLPELFGVVRKKEPELTVRDFHSGLRRLHDRGVIRLLPFEGPEGPPEPEYALLDGAEMYYYAAGWGPQTP